METTPIYMPLELLDLLEATAALNELSTDELIQAAINAYLEKQKEEI